MELVFEKAVEDVRGRILFFSYGKKFINFAEIKKGFARGGHYHPYQQYHYIIAGKVEYREENVNSKKESVRIIDKPTLIHVPPNTAHLFIAIQDTIFVESYEQKYDAINYLKYRSIVEKKMKSNLYMY